MEAFSPCVALDSSKSGVPVIYFTFTLTNQGSEAVTARLLMSQQNLAGTILATTPAHTAVLASTLLP